MIDDKMYDSRIKHQGKYVLYNSYKLNSVYNMLKTPINSKSSSLKNIATHEQRYYHNK